MSLQDARILFVVGHEKVGKSAFIEMLSVRNPQVRVQQLRGLSGLPAVPQPLNPDSSAHSELVNSDQKARDQILLDRALHALHESELTSASTSPATESPSRPAISVFEVPTDFQLFDHPIFQRPEVWVIWLRRRLDRQEWLSLLAPQDQKLSRDPVEGFQAALFRERLFSRVAHVEVVLADGDPDGAESQVSSFLFSELGWSEGGLILSPRGSSPSRQVTTYIGRNAPSFVLPQEDLRDDWIGSVTPDQLLIQVKADASSLDSVHAFDLALESVKATPDELLSPVRFISIFSRAPQAALGGKLEELSEAGRRFPQKVLKFEGELESWDELRTAFQWWSSDPARRVLLPRSIQGRWRWFHQLMVRRQPFSLFKVALGNGIQELLPDVPLALEWMAGRERHGEWGAYITHRFEARSATAQQSLHESFFRALGQPFLTVPLLPSEFRDAIEELSKRLGLTRIAVSEAFAQQAYELCEGRLSLRARRTGLVDTLVHGEAGWSGDHAAVGALRKCARDWRRGAGVRDPRAALSVLALIPESHANWLKEEFPLAHLLSSEEARAPSVGTSDQEYDWVIVGEGGGSLSDISRLGDRSIRSVVDLGLSESSLGPRLAWASRARYTSAWPYLRCLAQERKSYWSEIPAVLPMGRKKD